MSDYDFSKIEKKWQEIWEREKYGIATDEGDKKKFYNLVEFPYPSGEGLHVGHCMGYGATDVFARFMRLRGYNVLCPIGWDAFGLPTENFAIKNRVKPADATKKNVDTFRRQMKACGYSFDWEREVNTTDPNYYRWTQWIFLQFYKHAMVLGKLVEVADDDRETPRLAYVAEMPINWCPSCKIGLANEEVIAGKCERCGEQTEKKMQKQWMLRITEYADRLISDLETVDYLEYIKKAQINWIGKSVGSNIKFKIKDSQDYIEVFTTRADTLFGCTYVVISPESGYILNLQDRISNRDEVFEYIEKSKKKSELERTDLAKDKTGVKLLGVLAINPINGKEVEIWMADYVLANYGTGAVMAVPAHDERDFEFAKTYGIEIFEVIVPSSNFPDSSKQAQNQDDRKAFVEYGVMINSGDFDGLSSEEGKKKITDKLKEMGAGDFSINYKLRDWIFSRQHYWGEPIPIIHCEKCGMIPLSESDLPLTLPEVLNYEPTNTGESPLSKISEWVGVKCPKCGGEAKRETDTMPNWAGSSWYFLRYCDPNNQSEFASKENLKRFMPVDLYNGGNEHTNLHLLYSRFWHKFLFDLGLVNTAEPYKRRIAHGIILGADGQKMSKSKGNVINPDEIVKQFGADSLRAYIMFIGPYDMESAWNTAGVSGVFRFLKRVWANSEKISEKEDDKELLIKLNQTIAGVSDDIENFRMNTVVSKLMEMNNMIEKKGSVSRESYKKFLILLFPSVPHIACELWEKADFSEYIWQSDWPEANVNYLVADTILIVVQINGKVRAKIEVSCNISDEDLKKTALLDNKVKEWLLDKEPKKVIVVPKKLVSIVV